MARCDKLNLTLLGRAKPVNFAYHFYLQGQWQEYQRRRRTEGQCPMLGCLETESRALLADLDRGRPGYTKIYQETPQVRVEELIPR